MSDKWERRITILLLACAALAVVASFTGCATPIKCGFVNVNDLRGDKANGQEKQ